MLHAVARRRRLISCCSCCRQGTVQRILSATQMLLPRGVTNPPGTRTTTVNRLPRGPARVGSRSPPLRQTSLHDPGPSSSRYPFMRRNNYQPSPRESFPARTGLGFPSSACRRRDRASYSVLLLPLPLSSCTLGRGQVLSPASSLSARPSVCQSLSRWFLFSSRARLCPR